MNNVIKISIILFLLFGNVFAQNEDSNLILKESVEEPNCEILQLILDKLIVDVMNESQSIGYIVVFGSSDIIENAIYTRSIIAYHNFRKFDKSRYKVLTVKAEGKIKIETWLSKSGEKPPYTKSELSMVFPESDKPILFSKDMFDIVKIDGRLTYLNHGCDVCCMNSFNPYLLPAFLEANPNLNAQITVYAKKKKLAESLKQILIKEDINSADISSNRIKFLLGKKLNLTEQEKGYWINYFDGDAKGKYVIIEVLLIPNNAKN